MTEQNNRQDSEAYILQRPNAFVCLCACVSVCVCRITFVVCVKYQFQFKLTVSELGKMSLRVRVKYQSLVRKKIQECFISLQMEVKMFLFSIPLFLLPVP